jgi:hypothetical protein
VQQLAQYIRTSRRLRNKMRARDHSYADAPSGLI